MPLVPCGRQAERGASTMRAFLMAFTVALMFTTTACKEADRSATQSPAAAASSTSSATSVRTLPPSETTAKQALDTSPRHGEYVDIPLADGQKMRGWIVYP